MIPMTRFMLGSLSKQDAEFSDAASRQEPK